MSSETKCFWKEIQGFGSELVHEEAGEKAAEN